MSPSTRKSEQLGKEIRNVLGLMLSAAGAIMLTVGLLGGDHERAQTGLLFMILVECGRGR